MLIRTIKEVDFDKGKPFMRIRDNLRVTAVKMPIAFDIVLPSRFEMREEDRNYWEFEKDPDNPKMRGKKIIKGKRKEAVRHCVEQGGHMRGRVGDYICKARDGMIFAVPHKTIRGNEPVFEKKFSPFEEGEGNVG